MTTIILLAFALILGFAGGFYAGVRNASSAKVERARSILDALKGK
jgi:hypothetical protein